MVRLEFWLDLGRIFIYNIFQFLNGTIGVYEENGLMRFFVLFQFLNGTIGVSTKLCLSIR